MSCYISSSANRFYTALEPNFGKIPAVGSECRIPGVSLRLQQTPEIRNRRDKTGSRTFFGLPKELRFETRYELRSYLTALSEGASTPAYGPVFQAALGASPFIFGGGTVANATQTTIRFQQPHGLSVGNAITYNGELRFVSSVTDESEVGLNAPLTAAPDAGNVLGACASYALETELPSFSLFDFWSPETSVQRVVRGACVDKLKMTVNGDYQEFTATGFACGTVDNRTFQAGQAGLSAFPTEPEMQQLSFDVIPGHLGQAWIGSGPSRLATLGSAEITVSNNIDMRAKEFGINEPACLVPGDREVAVNFEIYARRDDLTLSLYESARQRSPIGLMFQLGQSQGQFCGIYIPTFVPEVPEFDDSENRLRWNFQSCRAHGYFNDEVYVAFG
jgi:hypothetical protein